MLNSITHTLVKFTVQNWDNIRYPATEVMEEITQAAVTQVITAAKKLKNRETRVLGRA